MPKRNELHWSGIPSNQGGKLIYKRRAFKGIEFLQSLKYDNLDISFGGNIFEDEGYRKDEETERIRFNVNSLFKSD